MANKENLKAAGNAALNKFFTERPGTAPAEKTEQPAKKTTKPKKEVFSFRAASETVIDFRAYCAARYKMTPDDIATEAMLEYIKAHPLESYEKDTFETKRIELRARYMELQETRANKQK